MWSPSSERKWERNRLHLTKSPRSSFLPVLLSRKMTDMIDCCQSCDFPCSLELGQKGQAGIDRCVLCMNWHRVRVIIASAWEVFLHTLFCRRNVAATGGLFLPLDACIVMWLFQPSQVVPWLPSVDGGEKEMAMRVGWLRGSLCWERGSPDRRWVSCWKFRKPKWLISFMMPWSCLLHILDSSYSPTGLLVTSI